MADSTYSKMINMMRVQGSKYNPSGIQIGTVITDNPLTVQVGDLPLNENNLLIADYLLSGYKRKVNIPNINADELSFMDGLKIKDTIAMIQISKSKYLILCRMVEP